MAVTGADIAAIIEEMAPLELAEPWDNPGWQLGDPGAPVRRILLCLDVNEAVCREALERDVQLIVTHHPLFFKEFKQIRMDRPGGVLVTGLIRAGVSVYAAHTNLDRCRGGVNDFLARRLGLQDIQVLTPGKEQYLKLVVFVPLGHVDAVRSAIGAAGAGWIGNYSDCTFGVEGTGTFRPLEGTNPYIGRQGRLEQVREVRLETIVPRRLVERVVRAMLEAHPYEEVAYDLYPLANQVTPSIGLGRIGMLLKALTLEEFVAFVKEELELPAVRWGGEKGRPVKRVALCGGSGGELWPRALALNADVFVTGDVGYHTARDMLAAGLAFVDAGHFGTERVILPALQEYLLRTCREKGLAVECLLSDAEEDPYFFS
ncbi:Nif3-like dinuclear metal center hexameric protein [Desulfofundulus thermosubterraneus]|uniref:GTP cyclohydrolase 1 type 2 homolog n=1 Tax=Desulfofundulus thermosubterraneus DSM 16057 TaxID=1121432 RepID=A0A1M6M826_9FIRM|nr:Nif3-like dinuclear metal center hexameric protein [Desulfofundulus thermosubterraneus]SHJ79615.1 dinuclear metal center protein, YbgI/SA1388 family [Desulfofundulus thermosubterraneus DSM 16057]